MKDKPVLYQVENNIGYLTINRKEKRNSLNHESILLLCKYLEEAENNAGVYVVCIKGAGEKAFCTGAELSNEMTESGRDAFSDYAILLKKISGFLKPVVGCINGYCLAGGMGLMLGCDIVIASKDTLFGTPEVNVGLFPMMIGALVFRNIPRKKAMEMVLLGEKISAAEALTFNMINRVVPKDQLDNETDLILKKLAASSPIGMMTGKNAFRIMSEMPVEHAFDYLCGKLKEVAGTEDAKEGITAFLEKRKPEFKGR